MMNTINNHQYYGRPSSSLSSTSSCWTGRVVARILAKDIPVEYDEYKKPLQAQISPTTYVPGTGPMAFRHVREVPIMKRPKIDCELPKRESERHPSTLFSSSASAASTLSSSPALMPEHSTLSSASDSASSSNNNREADNSDTDGTFVRIQFFLFPPEHHHPEPLTLNMIRKRREPVVQCLKRLQLSLAKKLRGFFRDEENPNLRKAKKGGMPCKTSISVSLEGKVFDVQSCQSEMTTEEFWAQAITRSMEIHVNVSNITITFIVECNPPSLVGVSTFEKFRSKLYPGVPIVIEVDTAYATGATVDWYVDRKLVCHDAICYKPTQEDAKKTLGVVITPVRPGHNGQGYEEAYEFSQKVEEELPENTLLAIRPSWQIPRDEDGSEPVLRVMSYNILADQNAYGLGGAPFFPWVADEILDRSRRMPLIVHEILAYHADVVCLQEVDEFAYESLFRPVMNCFNYQGYYSVKRSEGIREGCAIFFSLSRFQKGRDEDLKAFGISDLLTSISSNSEDGAWKDAVQPIVELFKKRPDLLAIIQNKLGHVVQIAHLRDLDGNPLRIANTHLFYHPNASHIRALQCFAIAYKLNIDQVEDDSPFILCGDFNSELWNCGTLLMDRKTSKNFTVKHWDWRKDLNTFSWEEDPTTKCLGGPVFDDDFPALSLPESFPVMVSGYPEYPECTHFVVGFKASLDHILCSSSTSKGSLKPLRQAPMASLDKVICNVAMPSPKFPSDHMSVLSDINWTTKDPKQEEDHSKQRPLDRAS